MTAIKICGITDLDSGLVALEAGADYLGFVFYPPSSRFIERAAAADLIARLREVRSTGWQAVGVFVNEPLTLVQDTAEVCQLDVVQLNGEETADYVRAVRLRTFKSVRFPNAGSGDDASAQDCASLRLPDAKSLGAERILLDANVPGRYGGTGVVYDWASVRAAVAEGFLAGGLTPENVVDALRLARPWGVDVSSGVEREGVKDPELIRAFIRNVRRAERGFDS